MPVFNVSRPLPVLVRLYAPLMTLDTVKDVPATDVPRLVRAESEGGDANGRRAGVGIHVDAGPTADRPTAGIRFERQHRIQPLIVVAAVVTALERPNLSAQRSHWR